MVRAQWAPLWLATITLGIAAQTGTSLPAWTPGILEIHQISTGLGNAALFILPDGTTLLVDSGGVAGGGEVDAHPDGSRRPGEWIARYIQRHLPAGVSGLDYAMITHFHGDHMGQVTTSSPMDRTGAYRLTGITDVAEVIRIQNLLDRGFPDYSYPAPLTDESTANYRRFVESRRALGMSVERFRPGSPAQITLPHSPAKYPAFEIRNIIGNGEVWTGTGDQTRQLFPPVKGLAAADLPSENMCSLGFRLQYGAFRYFTGGDLPGIADPGFPAWHSVEPAIAGAIGRVDVHVVNQHGSMDEESEPFLRELQSTILIVPAWAPSHPAPDVLKRIMNSRLPPARRYALVTDLRPSARTVIGARATQLAAQPGHIVVRVEPEGAQYRVFVLNSGDERDTVIGSLGPFASGGGQ